MRMFNKITIIGVGLIGGSIGLAIKKKGLAGEVTGVFRRSSTLKKALRCKAVDRATLSIKEGVRDADLIILATPVHIIAESAKDVFMAAKKGAIITDVASTKRWIVDTIEKLQRVRHDSVSFVGSHPMAGSERGGVENASSCLLEDSPCIVTKTPKTNKESLEKIVSFWKKLGSHVEILTLSGHDRSVALVSHLPHILAFALCGAVPERDLKYAAEGFRDTTRVASSDPRLWAGIFLTNKKEIARAYRGYAKYCEAIIKAVTKNDFKATVRLLKKAKSKRDKFRYAK